MQYLRVSFVQTEGLEGNVKGLASLRISIWNDEAVDITVLAFDGSKFDFEFGDGRVDKAVGCRKSVFVVVVFGTEGEDGDVGVDFEELYFDEGLDSDNFDWVLTVDVDGVGSVFGVTDYFVGDFEAVDIHVLMLITSNKSTTLVLPSLAFSAFKASKSCFNLSISALNNLIFLSESLGVSFVFFKSVLFISS